MLKKINLLIFYFNNKLQTVCKKNIKVVFSGRKDNLSKEVLKAMENIQNKTINNQDCVLNICLNYEFVPPDALFGMAKACICLNGIGNFTHNKCTAKELLQEQIVEFLIQRGLEDVKGIAIDGLYMAPNLFENTLQYGLVNTMAQEITSSRLTNDIKTTLEHFKEMIDLVQVSYHDEPPLKSEQSFQKRKY